MLNSLNWTMRNRFQAWMQKRLPPAKSIKLTQRRIFIFPSQAGFGFLACVLIILLAAVNYQNNMVFVLAFLLTSSFVVTILHTFANLSGLELTAVRAYPAFSGDLLRFDIRVVRHSDRRYYDISLSWPDSELCTLSLDDTAEAVVSLHLPVFQRGVFRPPRLLVETFYPLGILRCWTWLALDLETLVYPKPLACEWHSNSSGTKEEGEATRTQGGEDFYAFRDYQAGDSLKHIAWKTYAKGQSLQTKQFAAYRDRRHWLDWQDFQGDVETRLSCMCYWALTLESSGEDYGLRLPDVELTPAQGEAHLESVLKQLALFPRQ